MDDVSTPPPNGQSLSARVAYARTARGLFGSDDHVQLGRFYLDELIGRGGMGEVYRGLDPSLDRPVAIKLLHADLAGGDEARDRLIREASLTAKLNHPNVVSVYEAQTHEGQVYVVMELVEGETLKAWVDEHDPRSWHETVEMFCRAGDGLAAAHAKGIVHRDFKAENVLVGADGRPRVVDFGLASPLGELVRSVPEPVTDDHARLMTVASTAVGTPAYMAPEQFSGEAATAASDQFSFCVALWQSLYGQRPFAGDDVPTLMRNVIDGRRREAPRKSGVPTTIRAALERGLSSNPDDRFPSLGNLLHVLSPARRARQRRRIGTAVVAVGVLAAGLVMGTRDTGPNLCRDASARMEATWDDDRADRIADAIGAPRAAEFTALFDAYTRTWRRAVDDACGGDEVRHYAELNCLAWRLDELETLLTVLELDLGEDAERIAHELLVPIEQCTDPTRLANALPPPEDPQVQIAVQQLRAQLVRARVTGEVTLAEDLVDRAAVLGYPPAEAEACLFHGQLLASQQQPEAAMEALDCATERALRPGHAYPEVEAEAYVDQVMLCGFKVSCRPDIRSYFSLAQRSLDGLGDRPHLKARLSMNFSRALTIFGDPREVATAAVERARESVELYEHVSRPSGPAHAQLCLALVFAGEFEAGHAHCQRSLELTGEQHPGLREVLAINGLVLAIVGHDARAAGYLERCVAPAAEAGARAPPLYTGVCHSWLGNVRRRLGRPADALTSHEHALALLEGVLGDDHPLVARAYYHRGETWFALGDLDRAERDLEESARIWRRALKDDCPELAVPLVGTGRVLIARGRFEEARALIEDDVLERLRERPPGHSTDAQAHLVLAQAYAGLGDTRAARRHAWDALDRYAQLGAGFDPERAQARTIIGPDTPREVPDAP